MGYSPCSHKRAGRDLARVHTHTHTEYIFCKSVKASLELSTAEFDPGNDCLKANGEIFLFFFKLLDFLNSQRKSMGHIHCRNFQVFPPLLLLLLFLETKRQSSSEVLLWPSI